MKMRVSFVEYSAKFLAKATTIVVRYSLVRRQFSGKKTGQETQILDYLSQQYRVLPSLSAIFAIFFTQKGLMNLYTQKPGQDLQQWLKQMPELHALSCAMKVWCTSSVGDFLEELRFACGGHGYSQASGLPEMYGSEKTFFFSMIYFTFQYLHIS